MKQYFMTALPICHSDQLFCHHKINHNFIIMWLIFLNLFFLSVSL